MAYHVDTRTQRLESNPSQSLELAGHPYPLELNPRERQTGGLSLRCKTVLPSGNEAHHVLLGRCDGAWNTHTTLTHMCTHNSTHMHTLAYTHTLMHTHAHTAHTPTHTSMYIHSYTHTGGLAPSALPCGASYWLSVMMDVTPHGAQLCLPQHSAHRTR